MSYSVRGPDGCTVLLGDWWGEGDAYDDKGTNKAYSAAMKLCLLQAFVIPTQDLVDTEASVDPDAGEPTTTEPPAPQASAEQVARVKELVAGLTVDVRAEWAKGELATEYRTAYAGGTLTPALASDTQRSLEALAAMLEAPVTAELVLDEEPF